MLTIKVEAEGGSHIAEAFDDAIVLATKLDCFIDFDFNGVKCTAYPNGNPKKGVDEYNKAINSDSDYKFAMS